MCHDLGYPSKRVLKRSRKHGVRFCFTGYHQKGVNRVENVKTKMNDSCVLNEIHVHAR